MFVRVAIRRFRSAFRLIETGDIDSETLIDDRFSLTTADEALETFLDGETGKSIFDVDDLRN